MGGKLEEEEDDEMEVVEEEEPAVGEQDEAMAAATSGRQRLFRCRPWGRVRRGGGAQAAGKEEDEGEEDVGDVEELLAGSRSRRGSLALDRRLSAPPGGRRLRLEGTASLFRAALPPWR